MAKLNLYVVLLTAISIFVTLGLQAQPLEDKLSDWIDVFKGKLGINFPHSVVLKSDVSLARSFVLKDEKGLWFVFAFDEKLIGTWPDDLIRAIVAHEVAHYASSCYLWSVWNAHSLTIEYCADEMAAELTSKDAVVQGLAKTGDTTDSYEVKMNIRSRILKLQEAF